MRLEPNQSGSYRPSFAAYTLPRCPGEAWKEFEQGRDTVRFRKCLPCITSGLKDWGLRAQGGLERGRGGSWERCLIESSWELTGGKSGEGGVQDKAQGSETGTGRRSW